MIEPTVGRIVNFRFRHPNQVPNSMALLSDEQPFSAMIAYVHGPRLVNLTVTDHAGRQHPVTSVRLLQGADQPEGESHWCEWMPYQKGQAAKTEALEAKVAQQA
jgi:hypothetical protein